MKLGALLLTLLLAGAVAEAPVADAAQRGDVEVVRALLQRGADVNAAQGDGMSALHWAAMNGRPDMVDILLYAGANQAATTRLGGYTALHLASRAGHAVAVERLLQGNADPSLVTSTGVSALHYAAASGAGDAVYALVRHGAVIDARARADEQTPLMWATAFNRVEAMRVLLDAGADVSLTSAVIDYVAISAADRPARQLRQQLVTARRNATAGASAAEPAEPSEERQRARPVPEPVAPEEEVPHRETLPDTTRAEVATVEETKPPEVEEPAEETPSEEAPAEAATPPEEESAEEAPPTTQPSRALPEEVEEAERQLSYNDLVGLEGGFAALHFASRDGFVDAARLLLEHGADINQPTGGDATTPLLIATINGNFDLAMDYIEMGADPNMVAEDGSAPLFTVLNRRWGPKAAYPQPSAFTQQRTDYLELMTALLEAGAEVNHRTERHIWYTSFNFDQLGVGFAGATAFWRAAYATDLDAMRLLIEAGADPDVATRKVPSRRFGRPSGAAEDKSGLDPVPTGGPAVWPIHAASGVGYGEGFAANSHSHAPDSWLASIRYLVEELGADVNARDLNGYSPVHHAAARGDNELIEYLVSQGADVTYVSRQGETTVDMANGPRQRVQPFPATIALLESLGAVNNHNCQSC
ncbi:MAG: ankyrin repeat domain-containing protein [Gemmatimonadetes bacterium]|nr:ankyrin repeat domain-containing protein [Gemmatimonadota bacterium]MDA1104841.1 ankyrin repeat domain-containing protein [Gemmatimonadota bacterium]